MARKLIWIIFWLVVIWLLGGRELAGRIWRQYFPQKEERYFDKAEKYCFDQSCLTLTEGKWLLDDGKSRVPADENLAKEYQNKIKAIDLGQPLVTNKENFAELGIGGEKTVWLAADGKKLELGKITSSYDGTWVRPENEEVVYRIAQIIDNGETTRGEYWRQKYLYQLPRYQIKQISRTVAGKSVSAQPKDGVWKNEKLVDRLSNLPVGNFVGSCPSPLGPQGEYLVESESGEKYQFGYGLSSKLNKALVWINNDFCFEIDKNDLGLLTGSL